jgi:thiamine pyrophosphate-dependent acetolactate synthase large subunit-like protein
MELDTAVRHKLPLLCVISLNGGWTADPEGNKPGRYLGYTRYGKMAEALGCYAEYVEEPEEIRPALLRVEEGRGGHGRLCQRQDRLPRPCHDGALSSRET